MSQAKFIVINSKHMWLYNLVKPENFLSIPAYPLLINKYDMGCWFWWSSISGESGSEATFLGLVLRYLPSFENDRLLIRPVWSLSIRFSGPCRCIPEPDCNDHMMLMPGWPSREKATALTSPVWPLSICSRPCRCIPEPDCMIMWCWCQCLAVYGESNRVNPPYMAFKYPFLALSLYPEADSTIFDADAASGRLGEGDRGTASYGLLKYHFSAPSLYPETGL